MCCCLLTVALLQVTTTTCIVISVNLYLSHSLIFSGSTYVISCINVSGRVVNYFG